MAVLRATQGNNPGQIFPLEGDVSVMGRNPDCDIVLESISVSRQHARVSKFADRYYVEDLGSRNGTFVNQQAVVDRQLLEDNDELTICDLTFVFHHAAAGMDSVRETDSVGTDATAVVLEDSQASTGSTIMSKVDISTGSSGLQLGVNAETKLKAMLEITQNLGRALGLEAVLPSLLDSLFKIFLQADRGFVILKDPASGRLIPEAVKHRRAEQEETIRISRTIVNSVMTAKEAILSADAASDSRFDMAESIVDFHIRSVMCAPLVDSTGQVLGVIQIDTLDQRSRFTREDLDVLASVACQAAFSVENARLHEAALRQQALARELAVAHEVQRGFLPAKEPTVEDYEFFEFYDPAHELGGDYYDYIQLRDGRLAVVVADVSGKGIAASLLMAKLSAETRYCLASETRVGEAIGQLNRVFCESRWEDRFVTLVLCVLDPVRNEVTVVNAGHMPPLLRRANGDVEPVGEPQIQLPIGVEAEVIYPEFTFSLEPGESLTLFTDGITEAMNDANDLYGHDRLLAQLATDVAEIREIGQAILDDVQQFVGTRSQSDDMCLACFGRATAG